jgi:nitrous oxide reductase accessory protein NosL
MGENEARRQGRPGTGDGRECGCARHTHSRANGGEPGLTRRGAIVGGVGLAVGLAGCLGSGGGEVPEPVALTQADQCEVCGMVIPNHPGPSAEIFYRDQRPSGHDNPARFCSTWEAFQYDFERRDRGWTRDAFYVTDYSTVDYDLVTDAGDTLISTHPEAAAFVDAAGVTFVAGSEVKGAMGRDLIAFSAAGDAEAFQAEYGGDRLALDEVTRQTIATLANR